MTVWACGHESVTTGDHGGALAQPSVFFAQLIEEEHPSVGRHSLISLAQLKTGGDPSPESSAPEVARMTGRNRGATVERWNRGSAPNVKPLCRTSTGNGALLRLCVRSAVSGTPTSTSSAETRLAARTCCSHSKRQRGHAPFSPSSPSAVVPRGRPRSAGVRVALSQSEASVTPGGTASIGLTIVNAGTVVEQLETTVKGVPANWVTVQPDVVSLMPNAETTVAIRFEPPRAFDTSSGPHKYFVSAVSTVSAEASASTTGSIDVGTFEDVSVELTPQRSERATASQAPRHDCQSRQHADDVDARREWSGRGT